MVLSSTIRPGAPLSVLLPARAFVVSGVRVPDRLPGAVFSVPESAGDAGAAGAAGTGPVAGACAAVASALVVGVSL